MSAFSRLNKSTINFLRRFMGDKKPTMNAQVRVFEEEVREVIDATRFEDDEALAREIADVIVTMQVIAYIRGIPPKMLKKAMRDVALKNDSKTHKTHVIDRRSGKIRRRTDEEKAA